MKNSFSLITILPLLLLALGCAKSNDNTSSSGTSSVPVTSVNITILSETMISVMPSSMTEIGIDFSTGKDDNTSANIKNKFKLAKTEVTYELWKTVYDWATDSARGADIYKFTNVGAKGGIYNNGWKNNEAGNKQPVTSIDWRDAIVWCNAYTEWYNATQNPTPPLTVVYFKETGLTNILRDATATTVVGGGTPTTTYDVDSATYAGAIAWDGSGTAPAGYPGIPTATGFRLPTSAEWEFAARFQGTVDKGNSGSKASDGTTYYFTKGNSASGAETNTTNVTETSKVAWHESNSCADGNHCTYDNTFTSRKSKSHDVGIKTPNALGLYDMCGNLQELTFDASGSLARIIRGGAYALNSPLLQIGTNSSFINPAEANFYTGFRVARTE